jgi:CubicO group peptidase (beta-lactamase class C family)
MLGLGQRGNHHPVVTSHGVRFSRFLASILAGMATGLGMPRTTAAPWPSAKAEQVGMVPARLAEFSDPLGGHGCIIRHGFVVHTWGDYDVARDVASACKPVFTHFLLVALSDGRIPSLDQPLVDWEPGLRDLNPELGFKDRGIRWQHLIQQTSCYGLIEAPGTAFAYNDWQMALFADTLFGKVYKVTWEEIDRQVLGPQLTTRLGCEDHPSLIAFGVKDRPGRLKISPRDFARFGQLYLRHGRWGNETILNETLVRMATGSPLPATLPRAGTSAAPMIAGQRSLGSNKVPDNQTEHFGSYSDTWWINGVDASNHRHWPDAPTDTFAALGHGGVRALIVIPSLDLVVSWNDASIQSLADENRALGKLCAAVHTSADPSPIRPISISPPSLIEIAPSASSRPPIPAKRRVIIETDAGGDPDDEQSLVRFLLYADAWDVTGIIANRPQARDRENLNPARTGLAIIHRLLDAYASCWTNLVANQPSYPDPTSCGPWRSRVTTTPTPAFSG